LDQRWSGLLVPAASAPAHHDPQVASAGSLYPQVPLIAPLPLVGWEDALAQRSRTARWLQYQGLTDPAWLPAHARAAGLHPPGQGYAPIALVIQDQQPEAGDAQMGAPVYVALASSLVQAVQAFGYHAVLPQARPILGRQVVIGSQGRIQQQLGEHPALYGEAQVLEKVTKQARVDRCRVGLAGVDGDMRSGIVPAHDALAGSGPTVEGHDYISL
jgi:hypothetical protein